jgi:hypothetical protein
MASKDDLLKELNYLTEKISTLVWTLNLGALGLTWSLLITSGVEGVRLAGPSRRYCPLQKEA